jgi:DedD protein
MGLFSFLSKNKQGGAGGEAEFYSRADSDAKPRKRKQTKVATRADDEEPLDPVLPEKKRARRRLVGAVALVLAMIIGLPMLLDSEPKPVADDIAIQIPSRDKPPAPDMSLPAPVATPAAASTSTSAPALSSTVAASASLGPHEQIVNLPPPTEVKPKPADTVSVEKPADKPVVKPAEKLAEKPTDKPATDKDKQTAKTEMRHDDKDDARAQAILNGKDAGAKAADKKGGKFVVQVAALTSKDKITELQGKLSDAGFKPILQTVPTDAGPTTRVRVGPFESKEEAESAQAKLTRLGLSGKLLPL